MSDKVKICGVKSVETLNHCAEVGANFVGFVSFPKSPRHLPMNEIASLILQCPKQLETVILCVNPTYEQIIQMVDQKPDYIQLHGSESPEFCNQIKDEFDIKLIKAISVAEKADIEKARQYEHIVDTLLFDAKPIEGAELPGGNGQAFNWALLDGEKFACQTMLAGGLNDKNVAIAKHQSGLSIVDVSSAVEQVRGEKDHALITSFVKAAKTNHDMNEVTHG